MPVEDAVTSEAVPSVPPAELCFASGRAPEDGDEERRRGRSWTQLADDLATLSEELVADLEELTTRHGRTTSLCEGWDVRDVVVHLVVGDDLASRTLQGEDCFPHPTDDEQVLQSESRARVERLGPLDLEAAVERFRVGRHRLLGQLAGLSQADLRENVSWASKPISTFSMVQSRLMETWVHGWDLRHPLGIPTSFDDRAWWLTDIGVRHVPYSLAKAGVVAGPVELTVSLDGPAGGSWTRTFAGAAETRPSSVRVSGPAWAWAVLVTRRWPGRASAREALRVGPAGLGGTLLEHARSFA